VLTGEGSDEPLAGYSRYALTLKNLAFDRRQLRELIATSSGINAAARRKHEAESLESEVSRFDLDAIQFHEPT
jgi:asparagine synthetase B (glutamine-hydrolysing)